MAAADVVVASYSLTEIPQAALQRVLAELWRLAKTLLVIVEPGTPDGFRRILSCRDMLISAGGRVVAPCTHDDLCPLSAATRWCHFSKRLARSRDHLIAKNASVPFEDERFSYLAVAKGHCAGEDPPTHPRDAEDQQGAGVADAVRAGRRGRKGRREGRQGRLQSGKAI